jgi:hypothetical protein
MAIGLLMCCDRMDGKIQIAHSAAVVLSSPLKGSIKVFSVH